MVVKVAGEQSEPVPPLDTIKDKWNKGPALSDLCPRRGHVLLRSKEGVTMVNTSCNSWRCIACRNRNIYRFRSLVKAGISASKKSAFITITYREGSERLAVAGCVRRDWAAFWRIVRRDAKDLSGLPWLRVMELTKKGVPHFHLVVTRIPEGRRIRCYGVRFDVRRFVKRMDECGCVSHVYARAWWAVTHGESYIVHAVPVGGASGAASYLAKYMAKVFEVEEASPLGMVRRWSTSRNWEGEKRVRFEETHNQEWIRHWWAEGHRPLAEYELTEGVGVKKRSPSQVDEIVKLAKKRLIKTLEGMVYDGN